VTVLKIKVAKIKKEVMILMDAFLVKVSPENMRKLITFEFFDSPSDRLPHFLNICINVHVTKPNKYKSMIIYLL
jgi:hypothetical protein